MIANPVATLSIHADAGAHDAAHAGYRADIDGLRALAVLPVVLYHAGVRGFSGGYVGVDIFFVISGYLITGILLRDIDAARYSITDFYRRRVLRIFPALFAMILVVAAIACATMLPSEIQRFARSLASAAFFSSNIQFYLEAGYFGLASAVKPLLHTWSLAIEEQWYILWPLLLGVVGRRQRAWLLPMTIAITLASLTFGIWQTADDAAGAFFLLPSRGWELGLGALLAIYSQRISTRWMLQLAGIVGFMLILASIKTYTHETSFPGVAALAPCIGAALLIYSGSQRTWMSQLLSHRAAQFVGRISFSLYLWHWPVMVFSQIGLLLPQSPGVIVGQIGLSFALAVLSWKFIEQPFRDGRRWSTRRVLWSAALAIGSTAALAAAVPAISRAVMNFDARQIELASYADLDGDGLYRRGICFAVGPKSSYNTDLCLARRTGKPAILFAGDSYAAALWPGLSLHKDRFDVLQATATGCVAKLYARPEKTLCAEVINAALRDALPRERPQATVLASRWKWRTLEGLEETLRDPVVRAGNPILLGPVPEYTAALPRILVFADRAGDEGLIDRSVDTEVWAIDKAMREIARRTRTPYVSLLDLLCHDHRCVTRTPSGAPMQFDTGHLTPAGSEFIINAILPRIEKTEAQRP